MQTTLSCTFIEYKNQEIKGLVIGSYNNKYDLKKNPCFACLTGGRGSLSETTRQKDGVVYIPWDVLKDCSKIKIVTGKGVNYKYKILRDIQVHDYMIGCDVKEYNRQGEITRDVAYLNIA